MPSSHTCPLLRALMVALAPKSQCFLLTVATVRAPHEWPTPLVSWSKSEGCKQHGGPWHCSSHIHHSKVGQPGPSKHGMLPRREGPPSTSPHTLEVWGGGYGGGTRGGTKGGTGGGYGDVDLDLGADL